MHKLLAETGIGLLGTIHTYRYDSLQSEGGFDDRAENVTVGTSSQPNPREG